MSERDESKLPRWAQTELQNARKRAEEAEYRLRELVEPTDEAHANPNDWYVEFLRGSDKVLLRMPVSGYRVCLKSPLGFSFLLGYAKPGLLHLTASSVGTRPNRDRLVVTPKSGNVVEIGAVPMFGSEIDGD